MTGGGQVSVPAEIRHRWNSSRLTLEDHGDHVVLRPVPDDPIAAARGSLKEFATRSSAEVMAEHRAEEGELEDRRWAQS